ncbi:MAG TPA: aminomethyltransferase family protein [Nitrospiraceae bacterium]|nr:aminomethyltransferase family protein [Nitrospiraceae bacterium]
MKPLRLRDEHAAAGAEFGESAGWEVPRHYGNPAEEHRAVRQAVGLSDLSHRGILRVTGDDRVKWLQSVVSNDLLPLKSGQYLYSSLLTHKGKMLSYFRCYMQEDAVLLEDVGEIGDATYQAVKKFLLYGTKAKIENLSGTWGLLLMSGPRVVELIKAALGLDAGSLQPLRFVLHELEGSPALFSRTEETGETDIEILLPGDQLATVWKQLLTVGQPFGLKPVGSEARQALRMEAGLPVAGLDLTEEIVPPEANLEGKAFSLTKGCYPGQEVVARMDTYGSVRRHLVGLVLKAPTIPPRGAKLFSGDREVGWVSSAIHSPQLGQVIAFGFPLRDFSKPETPLTIDLDGQRIEAVVHTLPFYSQH